jgi:hypothetical protein
VFVVSKSIVVFEPFILLIFSKEEAIDTGNELYIIRDIFQTHSNKFSIVYKDIQFSTEISFSFNVESSVWHHFGIEHVDNSNIRIGLFSFHPPIIQLIIEYENGGKDYDARYQPDAICLIFEIKKLVG